MMTTRILQCLLLCVSIAPWSAQGQIEAYQTSAAGAKLEPMTLTKSQPEFSVRLDAELRYQKIEGFGGAFTESSAHLLRQLPEDLREEVMAAYFSGEGARYSLCRTHINSCDFSLGHYSYVEENDSNLSTFSLDEDRDDIIPMIKRAQELSDEGFKLIASPWTAPPWMKTNKAWEGGSLLPQFYDSWAAYFSRYISAMDEEGIDIWAVTVENEPLGNSAQWESMHYTPSEMGTFVKENLGPRLQQDHPGVNILLYDQNKGEELEEYITPLLQDEKVLDYAYGTAVHWYTSTVDWYPESLRHTHELAPSKHIIHTEACVDAEIPEWKNDEWYWQRKATDWGYEWAPEAQKKDHPLYVPVYRYARDIIGSLNNWVEGWVDWNMVLNRQGGPNWAENWCVAPVIVDTALDEVYYTPLYYTLSHFSRFIPAGSQRIHWEADLPQDMMLTAVQRPDGRVAVVALNMGMQARNFSLQLDKQEHSLTIEPQALITVILESE